MAVTTAAQSGGDYRCTSPAVAIASTSHMAVATAPQFGGDYRSTDLALRFISTVAISAPERARAIAMVARRPVMGNYAKAMMRVKREAADTANAAMVNASAGPEPMGSVADLLLAKKIDKQIKKEIDKQKRKEQKKIDKQIKKNEKAEGRIYNRVLLDAGIKSLGRLAANYTLATEGLMYLRMKLLQKKREYIWCGA